MSRFGFRDIFAKKTSCYLLETKKRQYLFFYYDSFQNDNVQLSYINCFFDSWSRIPVGKCADHAINCADHDINEERLSSLFLILFGCLQEIHTLTTSCNPMGKINEVK